MSDAVDKAVGAAIASYRGTKQWTQAQLAEAVKAKGLSLAQQTIAKIESGNRPLRLAEAVVFADALGLTVGDFLNFNRNRISRLTIDYWNDELDAAEEHLRQATMRLATARVTAATVVVRAEESPFANAKIVSDLGNKATCMLPDDLEVINVEGELIQDIDDKYERKTVETMFGY